MLKLNRYISLIVLFALSLILFVKPQAEFINKQVNSSTYTVRYFLTSNKITATKTSSETAPTKKEVSFSKAADIPQGGNILVPLGLLVVFIIGGIFAWFKLKDYFI